MTSNEAAAFKLAVVLAFVIGFVLGGALMVVLL